MFGDFFTNMQQSWCANKLHNGLPQKVSSFKHFYYTKSYRDIQFLLNWKNSLQFSGTQSD